jgi:hypothetical protein
MNDAERLGELRELFLSAPIPTSTLIVALLVGLALLGLVLWLVRRRALREEYTPIWLLTAGMIVVAGVWEQPISWLTRAIGAWTHTSTIFFLALVFLATICLNYAVRLSQLTLQMKNLSQEVAILRSDLRRRGADDPAGQSPGPA